MSVEPMEKIHVSLPLELKRWLISNKEKYDCDSINGFNRLIIRDFKKRVENGEIKDKTNISLSGLYFTVSLLLPLFLFVMGRINDNDIFLYSIGIISLSGPVMLYKQR